MVADGHMLPPAAQDMYSTFHSYSCAQKFTLAEFVIFIYLLAFFNMNNNTETFLSLVVDGWVKSFIIQQDHKITK